MQLQTRSLLLGLLNVKPREAVPMLYMLSHAFLNGLGIALAFTAININILENHGVDVLPTLYVIASGLLFIGGLTYAKIEHQIRPGKLFSIAIAICAVWAITMRFSLALNNSIFLAGLAFSTYYIVYLLCNLEFWGAAALLFDVRQGKRLFGPLAVGESLAKIIGYILSAKIITHFSLPDTFLVAGLSFLLSWFVFMRLKKKYDYLFQHAHSNHPPGAHGAKETNRFKLLPIQSVVRTLRADRFIRAVSIFAMIATTIYFTIHFAFLSQVKYEFKTLEEIATFFALFLSIAKAINLLIKMLLSSRILNFFGVKVALFILPVTLLIINVLGLIGLFNFTTGMHFFIIVFGLNYLTDEVLRSSLYTPTYLILFQPLAKNKRLEGHTISKGIMEPLGMGLAGILIIAWQATNQFNLEVLTFYIVGFTIIWLFATRRVNQEYLKILSKALKSRVLSRVRYDHSKEEIAMLRNEKLNSPDPYEILYAARLLGDSLRKTEWNDVARKLLASEDTNIQVEALNIIEEQHLKNFEEEVKMLVFSNHPGCVERAAYCYAALKEEESVPELLNHLTDGDTHRRMSIIGGILKHSGLYGAVSIGEEFLQLITSTIESDRVHAAKIIGRIGNPKYYHPLLILLKDESIPVRKAAIVACGTVVNARLVRPLLDQLTNRDLYSSAFSSIEKYGKTAMPAIRERAGSATGETLRRLIRLCARIDHPVSHRFLLPYIRSNKHDLRNDAIYSLFQAHYKAADAAKVMINQAIEDDLFIFSELMHFYDDCKGESFIGPALKNEMSEIVVPRILYLTSFISDRKSIVKILENSRLSGGDYRSNALELMENVMRRKYSRRFCGVMEKLFEHEENVVPTGIGTCNIQELIRFVFDQSPGELSYWLKANCIRSARQNALSIHPIISDEPRHTEEKVLREEWHLYEQTLN